MDMSRILKYLFFFIIVFNTKLHSQNSFINQYTANVNGLRAYSCTEARDGNYLLAAFGYSTSTLDDNLLVIKLDTNGDTLWTKFYDMSITHEIPRDIMATADSGFVVSGDGFIMKSDIDGNAEWIKLANTYSVKWIESIPEGYAFCISDIQGSPTYNYILKTDFAGNRLSAYIMYGGVYNWLYQMVRLSSGDYAVSVASYSHTEPFAYLLITDSNLNVKSYLYGEGDNMRCIESSDNDLILTYASASSDLVLKMDTMGTIKWIKYFDAGYYPASIDTMADGGVIICGNYYWHGDSASLYISRFDSTGNLVQTDLLCCYADKPLVRSTSDGGYITFMNDSLYQRAIDFVKEGPVGSTGCIQRDTGNSSSALQMPQYFVNSSGWFSPTPLTLFDDLVVVSSGCMANRVCISTAVKNELIRPNHFRVVPNPVNDHFRIVFDADLHESGRVEIYNQMGKLVYDRYHEFSAGIPCSINTSLLSGLYFVNITSNRSHSSERIIVIRE